MRTPRPESRPGGIIPEIPQTAKVPIWLRGHPRPGCSPQRAPDLRQSRCAYSCDGSLRARDGCDRAIPPSLIDLVPALLPAVPVDPYSGKELHYRVEPTSFIVYSVSADGHDDGGGSLTAQSAYRWGAFAVLRTARSWLSDFARAHTSHFGHCSLSDEHGQNWHPGCSRGRCRDAAKRTGPPLRCSAGATHPLITPANRLQGALLAPCLVTYARNSADIKRRSNL